MSKLPKTNPVDLDFSGLTYSVKKGRKKGYKTILKSVTGHMRSGRLTAIMGPSGAGKSTLMNIAAGYKTSNVEGTILVNGAPRKMKTFRKQSCYIMQEDHVLPFLSVQESMDVAAALKLGETVDLDTKEKVINEILEILSLKDARYTRASNLSGGERKRLSIAVELVNNPQVMFFDEPTSGLDSRNSFQCINLLQTLAQEGRTIICTIHQPSARLFEKFDYLIALAEGQCIYRGTITGLVPFLASQQLECPAYHNPADFLVEVASGEFGCHTPELAAAVLCGKCDQHENLGTGATKALDIVAQANGSSNGQTLHQEKDTEANEDEIIKGDCVYASGELKINIPATKQSLLNSPSVEPSPECQESPSSVDGNVFSTSLWLQFLILFKRTFLSISRDLMLTKLRLFAHIVVGILLGLLYYNIGNEANKVFDNASCLFFSMLFLLFTAMMPTILTFPLEMKVLVREHLNHWYSLKAYYLAKTMADLPFQIIFPLIFVVIAYFMTDQPHDVSRFSIFTAMCILTSLVAQALGVSIGAAMDVQGAVFFGPVTAIPMLLFSGFFVTFSTVPIYLRWLCYFSYVRYGFEGAMLAIYGFDREYLHCSDPYCHYRSPQKFLDRLDMDEHYLWLDLLMLFVFFIIIRTFGYFVLKWKIQKER